MSDTVKEEVSGHFTAAWIYLIISPALAIKRLPVFLKYTHFKFKFHSQIEHLLWCLLGSGDNIRFERFKISCEAPDALVMQCSLKNTLVVSSSS